MHNPLQYLIEGMDAVSFSACQGQYALIPRIDAINSFFIRQEIAQKRRIL